MLDTAQDDMVRAVETIVFKIAAQHDVRQHIGVRDSLVDKGMTSMAMVDLMLGVESAFDVLIPQRDMTPNNFQSIECLAELMKRLRTR